MDSSGEQLHPNWCALATIHIPLKRFIREGAAVPVDVVAERHEIRGVTGDEVRLFYDELVKEENPNKASKLHDVNKRRTRRLPQSQPKANNEIAFDRRKYFVYATTNNVSELRKMQFKADDINARDCFGWSALMMAACEGAEDAVRFLLELGVERNVCDKAGSTALQLAQKKGHAIITSLLQAADSASFEEPQGVIVDEAETPPAPFYCSTCQCTFTDSTLRQHITSTLHQFETRPTVPANRLQKFNIPCQHRGLRLMIKQGWNKESGLGPTQSGRLYPVKTVIRKQRTGLGIEQPPARVTHYEAFDVRATQRNSSDYYKKKPRTRNDMRRERQREWKRERRLRNELS